jgi:hypothetical protein
MKCKFCKKNELKQISFNQLQERCTACRIIFTKELERKKRELERKKKEVKKKYSTPSKKCLICSKSFKPSSIDEKYCNDPCNYRTPNIAEINKKWIERKVEKNPKRRKIDSNMVAYSFFRKKYGVKDKFTVCRG